MQEHEAAPKQVVIVEDNDDLHSLLATLVTEFLGRCASVHATGEGVLAQVREGHPTFVLLDFAAPGSFALLRALKDDPATAPFP